MKKSYKLKNLGCANCAAKMERQIGALEQVENCSVVFMTAKLTLEAAEDQMDSVVAQATSIIQNIEPQVELVRA